MMCGVGMQPLERLSNFTRDYWGLEAREKEAAAEVKTLSTEEQVKFVLLGADVVANRLCVAPMILSKALSIVRGPSTGGTGSKVFRDKKITDLTITRQLPG
jgi:hypothetical protein